MALCTSGKWNMVLVRFGVKESNANNRSNWKVGVNITCGCMR